MDAPGTPSPQLGTAGHIFLFTFRQRRTISESLCLCWCGLVASTLSVPSFQQRVYEMACWHEDLSFPLFCACCCRMQGLEQTTGALKEPCPSLPNMVAVPEPKT